MNALSLLFYVTASLIGTSALAQVISPSATEVSLSYEASFLARDTQDDPESAAEDHASHIFGLLHSSRVTEAAGVDHDRVEGLGAPRLPQKVRVLGAQTRNGRLEVRYSATSKLLLHKKAAKDWIARGGVTLPLPYDLTRIYDRRCTDAHYDTEGDYWYFYDPYRSGCTYLLKKPYSRDTLLRIRASTSKPRETSPKLNWLRGDNGNGKLFSIYVVHGFAEDAKDKNDPGRGNFEEFNSRLRERGLNERIEQKNFRKPLHVFRGDLGGGVEVEIRNLLVDTGIESKSKSFARYFKEAVETADVILYAGHSGLGGNLDIPSLEEKAGSFRFNPKKRQIFFFDSCSSYSYYLDSFGAEKTKSKIDVITNGLSSYFHTSTAVHEAFLDVLLDTDADPTWTQLLESMEEPLDGASYLLNVGGV
jgi:hypothetical protein